MRIVLALLLFSSTAYAERHEISVGGGMRALHTPSANAVTDESLGGGQYGYAHILDLDVMPDLSLWAHAGMEWGTTEGTMFQTLTTEVSMVGFTAGARARYDLHRLAVVSARLDLGTQRAAFSLRDGNGHTASDAGWGAVTSVGGSLDLFAIRMRKFALGVRFDLGYVAASGINLVATPESGSEGTLKLQMTAAGLGTLDLSGATFGCSVVSRF
jgi:hypothetical protein